MVRTDGGEKHALGLYRNIEKEKWCKFLESFLLLLASENTWNGLIHTPKFVVTVYTTTLPNK
jgi:hypothetical protein